MLSPTGSELNIAKPEPDLNPFLKTRARPEPVNFKPVPALMQTTELPYSVVAPVHAARWLTKVASCAGLPYWLAVVVPVHAAALAHQGGLPSWLAPLG